MLTLKLMEFLEALKEVDADIVQICIIAPASEPPNNHFFTLLDETFTIRGLYQTGWSDRTPPILENRPLSNIDIYEYLNLYILSNDQIDKIDNYSFSP